MFDWSQLSDPSKYITAISLRADHCGEEVSSLSKKVCLQPNIKSVERKHKLLQQQHWTAESHNAYVCFYLKLMTK